jgi:hypothetical protein
MLKDKKGVKVQEDKKFEDGFNPDEVKYDWSISR